MPFKFKVAIRIAVICQHLVNVVEVLSWWVLGGSLSGWELYRILSCVVRPRSPFPFNLPFIPSF
jgi:hypothetical protein